MYDLLIENVHIVKSDKVFIGNVGIKGEKIVSIFSGECENIESLKKIDGTDKFLFPGFIDSHVHLNDPGFTWREDFPHGTKAAAIGGITTIIDMPLQNEPALTDSNVFLSKEKYLIDKSYVDYAFWGALVNYNLNKLEELNESGVLAFKCFFAPVSNDYTPLNAGEIKHALSILKKFDGLAGFHCEDYSIITFEEKKALSENRLSAKDFLNSRPVSAELIAVKTIICLAKETGAKVHICHVSHPLVAEEIKKAKADGVKITAETCPHYLIFNEEDLIKNGALFKCAPPLRKKEDSLWPYILDGTIDIISSDHSPCAEYEKDNDNIFKAWGGISGIQNGFQIILNESQKRNIPYTLLSKLFSYNASKIFGLNNKGDIEIGYDADLVLVDLKKNWEITTESLEYLNKISAFTGVKGKGTPICTILRGKILVENNNVMLNVGYGKLIKK